LVRAHQKEATLYKVSVIEPLFGPLENWHMQFNPIYSAVLPVPGYEKEKNKLLVMWERFLQKSEGKFTKKTY
tara:strand:+ start:221 stop:436 length:216 start_codon:yes stop_codon:yes gene_type:complete